MPFPLPPGDHLRQLTVGDRQRTYHLHIPPGDAGGSWPLVLGFHGGASNGRAFAAASGLSDKADAAGFVVAYPNGSGEREKLLTWNAGNCCGYAYHQASDDVGFTHALLDDLAAALSIDPRRVFATGLSNGAMLAYRLAAEMADRIAAIAPVAGPVALDRCAPSRPVSVIHLHGTEDLFTPLEGGVGPRSATRVSHTSVAETIRRWVAANGCPPEPNTAQLPDLADDGTHVVRSLYGPGREGSEVVLYVIHGGGHTWPGQRSNTFLFGPSTRNLIANDAIWDFFSRHGR